jgi:hypothetical protein
MAIIMWTPAWFIPRNYSEKAEYLISSYLYINNSINLMLSSFRQTTCLFCIGTIYIFYMYLDTASRCRQGSLVRTAEKGGRGASCPGPPGFWGSLKIIFCAPVIFLGEIFARKGPDIYFLGKVPKFGIKNWGKVAGKQLQRTRAEKFFRKNFLQEELLKKICPGPPRNSRRPCLSSFHFLQ